MAARKAVNLNGQIYFDPMTGPPLVKEHRRKVKNWLALSDPIVSASAEYSIFIEHMPLQV